MDFFEVHNARRRIAILGSTGSIGTQALEIIRQHADIFEVEVLTAQNNVALLIEQCREFQPNAVVIGNPDHYAQLKEALQSYPIKVYAGEQALCQVVTMDSIDIVLTAMVGFAGLRPTIQAIEAGKPIALANKETLVVAGAYITRLAQEKGVNIYPVDSEHSAIFQCLLGEFHNRIEKIILTASGGPFRGYTRQQLQNVSSSQALKHPNWQMGAKITIDSATLMNKGLEIIEAKWLFGLEADQIEVVVHPQSIIHSMVQFEDGSIKAQMGLPDMKLPILFALAYPRRYKTLLPRFDFRLYPQLTFEPPDTDNFPCLALAYQALRQGGNMPCILNAANEVAVQAFLQGQIGFLDIPSLIEHCMKTVDFITDPSPEDYFMTDQLSRRIATEALNHV